MINKTFKGGRTHQGAKGTIAYLLNFRVEEGTSKILEGSPKLTENIIELASQKFQWSWSSGVLSFEETLTEEQKMKIIQEHKKVFGAGLEENLNFLYINHEDKNRTEIHYIIPRIELSSGKSFNPYWVKKDFKKKDLFQDFINLKYNFSSHKDNPSLTKTKTKKWSTKKSELIREIDNYILEKINDGDIESRADIIRILRENFELSRIGKTSISIIDEDGKNHRLKGLIYGEDFGSFEELETKITREKIDRRDRAGELAKVSKQLFEIVGKQQKANRKRYQISKNNSDTINIDDDKFNSIITRANKRAKRNRKDSLQNPTPNLDNRKKRDSTGQHQEGMGFVGELEEEKNNNKDKELAILNTEKNNDNDRLFDSNEDKVQIQTFEKNKRKNNIIR